VAIQEAIMSQTQTMPADLAAALANSQSCHGASRPVRDYLARLRGQLRILRRRETQIDRLDRHMLRDIGLVPGEPPHAPLWGHGGFMWRP
jgi:hypothetical protein